MRRTPTVLAAWSGVAVLGGVLATSGRCTREEWLGWMVASVASAIAIEVLLLRSRCSDRSAALELKVQTEVIDDGDTRPRIFIDGANLAWRANGASAAGLLDALAYFRERGCSVTAVLPRSLCVNARKDRLCDGRSGGTDGVDTRDAARFTELMRCDRNGASVRVFRHAALWAEHERGALVLVQRQRKSDDDIRVLELATAGAAGGGASRSWGCSNDRFREHSKARRFAGLSDDGGHLTPWLRRRRIAYRYEGRPARFTPCLSLAQAARLPSLGAARPAE